MDIKSIGMGITSLILAGTLVACGGTGTGNTDNSKQPSPGTFSTEIVDGDNAVKLTAKEAEEGSAAIGATVTIKQGELLAISPDLEKGAVKVRLSATTEGDTGGSLATLEESVSSRATLEENVSGHVLNTYAVDPAEYTIGFSVADKEKVTGTVLVSTINAEEYQKQNAALEQAVSEADAATNGAASKAIGDTVDKANKAVEQVTEKVAGTDTQRDAGKTN